MLQRRIQRLQPAARQVLDAAAVLGNRHDFALLQAISGRDGLETADGLDELVARQMLDPLPTGLQFHHDLIRETAYGGMSSWRRRLLHGRAAEALEARLATVKAGTRRGMDEIEFQEIDLVRLLAEQHTDAGHEERAVSYLVQAGRHADMAYANDEAMAYFNRALDLVPEDDLETRWEILHVAEAANNRLGQWEAAKLNAEQLLALAERSADPEKLVVALLRREWWFEVAGDYEAAEACVTRAIDVARTAGSQAAEATALGISGRILVLQGRYGEARETRAGLVAQQRALGNRSGEAWALFQLGTAAFVDGDPAQAEELVLKGLAVAQDLGNRDLEALVLEELAFYAFYRGDEQEAGRYLDKARQLCHDIGGDPYFRMRELVFLGEMALAAGEHAQAASLLARALDQTRAMGYRLYEGYALVFLGHALARLGKSEGMSPLLQGIELLEAVGETARVLWARSLLAGLALAAGDRQLPGQIVEEILCFADSGGQLRHEHGLAVLLTCVQVLQADDDPRAGPLLERAHARMHVIADSFDDAQRRVMFLENVPWHREITYAWEAMQAEARK